MTDKNAAFSKQVLNVTKAEVEAEVEPDGVGDDLGREAIASKRRRLCLGCRRGHQLRLIAPRHSNWRLHSANALTGWARLCNFSCGSFSTMS